MVAKLVSDTERECDQTSNEIFWKICLINTILIITLGTRGLAACPDIRLAFSGLLVGAETHSSLAGG